VQALITDEGLSAIGKLRSLSQLDLEANQLSDAGIAHLAGLENLRTLGLAGNEGVTDQAFQALASLSMLASLDLSGTAVTDQGLTALKAALPNCQIAK
jgi:Leucine-rich repeat (LRR) protein